MLKQIRLTHSGEQLPPAPASLEFGLGKLAIQFSCLVLDDLRQFCLSCFILLVTGQHGASLLLLTSTGDGTTRRSIQGYNLDLMLKGFMFFGPLDTITTKVVPSKLATIWLTGSNSTKSGQANKASSLTSCLIWPAPRWRASHASTRQEGSTPCLGLLL